MLSRQKTFLWATNNIVTYPVGLCQGLGRWIGSNMCHILVYWKQRKAEVDYLTLWTASSLCLLHHHFPAWDYRFFLSKVNKYYVCIFMILIMQWMNTSAERNMMAEGRLSVLKPLYRLPYINSSKQFLCDSSNKLYYACDVFHTQNLI